MQNISPKQPFLRADGFAGFLFVAVLAAAYVFWGFPSGFIQGTSSFWQMETQDITVYVAGFMAFFQEPWHWPLLRIQSVNWPEGTLATFVDAIPLYALLLKLLVPASAGPFNPYGAWIGLCLVFQAVGAWWTLREAELDSWPALLALTCLLLTMPIMQHRLGHVSLFSQWILVFALALLLRSQRQGYTSAGWCGLLLCAVYINIYLTIMAALIYMADLMQHLARPTLRRWLFWPILTVVLAGSTMLVTMWPLPGHHQAQDGGFGVYSMNLLAPLTGSQFFPLRNATISDPQAVEGFNYLGLGVVLLLIWLAADQIAFRWRPDGGRPRPLLTRSAPFWAMMALMTIYALSNKVYWGSVNVISWPLPDFTAAITGSFRASGRFFWPVVYAVTVFGVIAVARRFDGRSLAILLGVVTVLQVADRWTAIQSLYGRDMATDGFRLNRHDWETALGPTPETLYFYPKMRCAKNSSFYDTLLPVMRYAAERGINISTGYIARYAPDCNAMQDEARSSDPAHSAYVFVRSEYSAETISEWLPQASAWQCTPVDFATVCTAR